MFNAKQRILAASYLLPNPDDSSARRSRRLLPEGSVSWDSFQKMTGEFPSKMSDMDIDEFAET